MHFTTVASVAALVMGASAAPTPGPYDPYVQIRLYPQSDCEQPNVGYVAVRGAGVNKCGQLDGTYTIRSVNVEQVADAAKGCQRK